MYINVLKGDHIEYLRVIEWISYIPRKSIRQELIISIYSFTKCRYSHQKSTNWFNGDFPSIRKRSEVWMFHCSKV